MDPRTTLGSCGTVVDVVEGDAGPVSRHGDHLLSSVHVVVEQVVHIHVVVVQVVVVEEHVRDGSRGSRRTVIDRPVSHQQHQHQQYTTEQS